MSTIVTYTVDGMSCEHCVNAVRGEVLKLAGVSNVAVNLERGTVEVSSDRALDPAAVAAAIDEAGYELVHP